jgi:hypothetical protein
MERMSTSAHGGHEKKGGKAADLPIAICFTLMGGFWLDLLWRIIVNGIAIRLGHAPESGAALPRFLPHMFQHMHWTDLFVLTPPLILFSYGIYLLCRTLVRIIRTHDDSESTAAS